MTKNLIAASSTLVLLTLGSSAHALMIDDFTVSGPPTTGCTYAAQNVASGGALGGSRTMTCTQAQGTGSTFETQTLDPVLGSRTILNLDNGTGDKADPTVVWNANGAGLANVDLTEGGTQIGFGFDVYSVDLGDAFSFTLTVEDGTNSWIYAGSSGPNAIPAPGGSFPPILFTAFTGSVGNPLTALTSATKITLAIVTQTADSDFGIDNLQTVPEPASVALIGMGLVLIGARRRARKA